MINMDKENNFTDLERPKIDLDGIALIDLFPDVGLDLPQPSNEILVESNNSRSMTNPNNNSTSHTIENFNQLDQGKFNLHHDRKHKLDFVSDLGSPPKISKDTTLCTSQSSTFHPYDKKKEEETRYGPIEESLVANRVGCLGPCHKMTTRVPTQALDRNGNRPTFYDGFNDVIDLNHTVTSQNNQSAEHHVEFPVNDITVGKGFSDTAIAKKVQTPVVPVKRDLSEHNKNHDDLMNPIACTSAITYLAAKTIQPRVGVDPPVIDLVDDEVVSKGHYVESQLIKNQKKYDESVFQQLIDIFPEADEDFIKEQCCLHTQINSVIEVILDMDNTYPKKINISGPQPRDFIVCKEKEFQNLADSNRPTSLSTTHQGQFQFLMQIFPDADPTFLESKSKLSDQDLKTFVSDALENGNYPKIDKTASRPVKIEESEDDLGLFTSTFDIKKFLNVVKEPFTYYFDDKRECQISTHALEFMKRRFRTHSIKLINQKYKDLKYNLSKTCEFLEKVPATRQTKRSEYEIRMPVEINRPFLQEACFVEHKQEIKEYLDKIESDRQAAYALAEERGELIECGCCFQELLFEECAACNEGDLFCKTCIQKSAEVRIGDGLTTFPCLVDCPSSFSLNLLQDLLEPQVFSRLLKRIQLDEVKAADIEGLEVCPFCEFATIPPPENKVFTCLNPDCLKESCRQCHKESHIPKRCDEIENDDQERARKYIEDEMTRALVRECYKCKRSFIKSDGCNKMTCTCGAKMCYVCRQPVTDYKHFNGQGGTQTHLCPLYSTEKLLHVDAVADIAKKAVEKVKAENPDLKLLHDPSKDLPSPRQASTALPPGVEEAGPHLMQRLNNFIFPAAAVAVVGNPAAGALAVAGNPAAGALAVAGNPAAGALAAAAVPNVGYMYALNPMRVARPVRVPVQQRQLPNPPAHNDDILVGWPGAVLQRPANRRRRWHYAVRYPAIQQHAEQQARGDADRNQERQQIQNFINNRPAQ